MRGSIIAMPSEFQKYKNVLPADISSSFENALLSGNGMKDQGSKDSEISEKMSIFQLNEQQMPQKNVSTLLPKSQISKNKEQNSSNLIDQKENKTVIRQGIEGRQVIEKKRAQSLEEEMQTLKEQMIKNRLKISNLSITQYNSVISKREEDSFFNANTSEQFVTTGQSASGLTSNGLSQYQKNKSLGTIFTLPPLSNQKRQGGFVSFDKVKEINSKIIQQMQNQIDDYNSEQQYYQQNSQTNLGNKTQNDIKQILNTSKELFQQDTSFYKLPKKRQPFLEDSQDKTKSIFQTTYTQQTNDSSLTKFQFYSPRHQLQFTLKHNKFNQRQLTEMEKKQLSTSLGALETVLNQQHRLFSKLQFKKYPTIGNQQNPQISMLNKQSLISHKDQHISNPPNANLNSSSAFIKPSQTIQINLKNIKSEIDEEKEFKKEQPKQLPMVCAKVFQQNIEDYWKPDVRGMFRVCQVGEYVYLYGGSTGLPILDMSAYSINSGKWKQIDKLSNIEDGRDNHTMISYKNSILIFGGERRDGNQFKHRSCLNETTTFIPENQRWNAGFIDEKNKLMEEGRAFHKACAVYHPEKKGVELYKDNNADKLSEKYASEVKKEGIYFFGGKFENGQPIDKLTILQTSTKPMVFFEPTTTGIKPRGRYNHSMNLNTKTKMLIIYGGQDMNLNDDEAFFDDMYLLRLSDMEWIECQLHGSSLSGRCQHESICYNNQLYLFGGVGKQGYYSFEVPIIELDQTKVRSIILHDQIKSKSKINQKSQNQAQQDESAKKEEQVSAKILITKGNINCNHSSNSNHVSGNSSHVSVSSNKLESKQDQKLQKQEEQINKQQEISHIINKLKFENYISFIPLKLASSSSRIKTQQQESSQKQDEELVHSQHNRSTNSTVDNKNPILNIMTQKSTIEQPAELKQSQYASLLPSQLTSSFSPTKLPNNNSHTSSYSQNNNNKNMTSTVTFSAAIRSNSNRQMK